MKTRWVAAVGLCCWATLAAAELTVRPQINPSVLIDDNRRVKSRDGSGLVAAITELGILSEYRRPTYALDIHPRFKLTRNSSSKELDAEDYFVRARSRRIFERHTYGLQFDFSRERSAITELEELGQIDSAVPKTLFSIGGNWDYTVSPEFLLILYSSHTDVSYESVPGSSLVDYSYSVGGINVQYSLSEQTRILGRSSVSAFLNPEQNGRTTSYTFQFGFSHNFTEDLEAELLIGQNIGRSKFAVDQQFLVSAVPPVIQTRRVTETARTSGQVITTEVKKTFEEADWRIEWSRNVYPSSLGTRQRRERVLNSIDYRVQRNITLVHQFEFTDQSQEAGLGFPGRPLKRYSLASGIRYRFSDQMQMSLMHRFVQVDRGSAQPSAESNRVTLSLRYSGNPITIFR